MKTKDFVYIIIMLSVLIIWSVSVRLSDNSDIVNIISIGSGAVSIVLGIVAIIISTLQNNSTSNLNIKIRETLVRMDEKLNNVRERLSDSNTYSSKDVSCKANYTDKSYTRVHIVTLTRKKVNNTDILDKLRKKFKDDKDADIIDYSVNRYINSEISTNIVIILNKIVQQDYI